MPGRLVFSTTADGANSVTEKLRITANGTLLANTTNTSNTGNTSTPILLLGNKTDLESTRVVTTEMGETLAERYNCLFLECSAKTYNNISIIYFMLIDRINKMIEEQKIKITDIENEHGIKYVKNKYDHGVKNQNGKVVFKTYCNIKR